MGICRDPQFRPGGSCGIWNRFWKWGILGSGLDASSSGTCNQVGFSFFGDIWIIIINDISQFSTVNAKLHPPASILNEVQHVIALTDYEVLVHFTIVFLAFNLICSKPSLYTLDMTDIELFRVLLHAITNPNVRFPPKIFDILLNLTAIRESM